jgi:hypothetical protein
MLLAAMLALMVAAAPVMASTDNEIDVEFSSGDSFSFEDDFDGIDLDGVDFDDGDFDLDLDFGDDDSDIGQDNDFDDD